MLNDNGNNFSAILNLKISHKQSYNRCLGFEIVFCNWSSQIVLHCIYKVTMSSETILDV